MKLKLHTIAGQPSWQLKTSVVEAAVTRLGGHLGPVRFRLGRRWIAPYDLAPWAGEPLPAGLPPLLRVMRGDFFCLPFGDNATPYRGEKYPPHGETANRPWRRVAAADGELRLTLDTAIRKGRVEKIIRLVPGHTAVYCRHIVSGMSGPMSFAHHAILKLPGAGAGRLSVSKFRYGRVLPQRFEDPAAGGYSILKAGAQFSALDHVPRADGQRADLSVYPAREGYEDLALVAAAADGQPFAWTALTVASGRYVWFALKDPRVLPATVLWMSNGGRHYAPWNGRHRHAIGLEEVCSYFHLGLAQSARRNDLNRAGIPTCARLDPRRPLTVNYIMAVAAIPRGFDMVKDLRPVSGGGVVKLTARSGATVSVPLDYGFLRG
ncbi:MAG: hypothetical protein LBK60_05400 [Verrucomicrobiales bacterium]|jgi:hypothetical protein|nr:hypothetical protein [Verrucomicrobiales bacterium]